MNKVTRTLLMTGMGIAASVAIGAGSASAASAAPASPSAPQASSHTVSQAAKLKDRTRIIRYYDNVFFCNRAGRAGQWQDRWDSYNCVRVRFGFHRGDYALIARWFGHGGGHWGDNHGGNGGNWGDDNHGGNWGDDNHGGNWGDDNHGDGHGPWHQQKH